MLCTSFSYYPAENLIEYKWPPDEAGEYYMLQEQVSEYLGVTSFKRKYPGTAVLVWEGWGRTQLRSSVTLVRVPELWLLCLLTNVF